MADPQIAAQIMEVLSDPMNLPPNFWNYSVQRWLADAPVFPISQVFGFTQFNAQTSTLVTGNETTSSATYTNLATDGPSLLALADGHYLVVVTSWSNINTAGGAAYASVSVNAATPADSDASLCSVTAGFQSAIGVSLQTLNAANNNTLKMQYKVGNAAHTGLYTNRRLIAIKYANL